MPKQSSLMEIPKTIIEYNPSTSSIKQKIHQSSVIFSTITTGVRNLFMLISSILHANTILPIVSFVLRAFIMLGKAFETASDAHKTLRERLVALSILVMLSILSILSFVYGYVVAASLSLVIASTFIVLEGIEWWGNLQNKIAADKAYTLKKEFDVFIENQDDALEHDQFNELLDIRYTELTFLLEQTNLTQDEQKKHRQEQQFISSHLQRKNIIPETTKPAEMLIECHKHRQGLINQLMELISSDPVEENSLEIKKLQHKIALLDKKIKKITAKAEDLKKDLMMVNQKFALSSTSFFITLATVALAAVSLSFALGSAYLAPVIIILGITVTAINLIHFIVDKALEYQAAKATKTAIKNSEEAILSECYSRENKRINPLVAAETPNTMINTPLSNTPSPKTAEHEAQTHCASVIQAGFFHNPTHASDSVPENPSLLLSQRQG